MLQVHSDGLVLIASLLPSDLTRCVALACYIDDYHLWCSSSCCCCCNSGCDKSLCPHAFCATAGTLLCMPLLSNCYTHARQRARETQSETFGSLLCAFHARWNALLCAITRPLSSAPSLPGNLHDGCALESAHPLQSRACGSMRKRYAHGPLAAARALQLLRAPLLRSCSHPSPPAPFRAQKVRNEHMGCSFCACCAHGHSPPRVGTSMGNLGRYPGHFLWVALSEQPAGILPARVRVYPWG
jgi:hypothetical protein